MKNKNKGGSWYARKRRDERSRNVRAGLASAALYGVILSCLALTATIRPVMAEMPPDAPQAANLAPAEAVEAEPETVEAMVRRIASEGGVDPDRAVAIAMCESRLDPSARNWQGSTATGLFQFIDSTWKYIGSPGDRLSAEDSARAFTKWYPGHESWWKCHDLTK